MMPQSQNHAPLPGYLPSVAFAALLLAAWLGASPASGQSFDCHNARYGDEKAICRESRLGDLDKELADVYDRVGGKLSKTEREAYENNETAFVNARHRCGENQACIEQSYRNRLQELRAALPGDEPDQKSGQPRRSDRQQTSSRDRGKTENERGAVSGVTQGTPETATSVPERTTDQGKAGAAALPPPPVETPARHNETVGAVPNPPSRHEAEAALAGTAPPEQRSRREKHSRHKESVNAVSVSPAPPPEHEKPPTSTAAAVPEPHARATGSSTAAAQPASQAAPPAEKKHSRAKRVATETPAPSPAPADQAKPEAKPEIKWVNPAPSR